MLDLSKRCHSFEDMFSNLDKDVTKLGDTELKLKSRKCQLFDKEVKFLGLIISLEGIETDQKKVVQE